MCTGAHREDHWFKAVAKAAVDFDIIVKYLVLMSYVQKINLLETLKVFETFFL